ncbi:LLM class flavin-dependent oxidoreductase [Amycolatopsis sp. NPDC101161]|uniref:LLM class flavin-dependent oxidoreductase n=1 Tax=Amycolatopsis sp. NPDC101161 TaxID=3363940 RepID=UPI00382873BC
MTDLAYTVALPPTRRAPEHIQYAEELGYSHAFLFDTPFQGDDVWVQLHRAAERTSTIGLGPGVLVPSLRHPLVNAANTVSLHQLAPGRVNVAFGTGFSSRAATGQSALKWSYLEQYVQVFQALLRGESADWEGAPIKLLLTSDLAGELPLRVPLLIGAIGPKGDAVARRLGADGLFGMLRPTENMKDWKRASLAILGTPLDPGERVTDERVRLAAGPLWGGMFHFVHTMQGADAVREMPGGPAWLEVVERVPERERHLVIHQGHVQEMNEADRAAWDAGGHVSLTATTWTAPAEEFGAAVRALAGQGVTEVQLQPTGPDIRRELEVFADAVRA